MVEINIYVYQFSVTPKGGIQSGTAHCTMKCSLGGCLQPRAQSASAQR